MDTPVWDFVNAYAKSGVLRLHMPGHKGADFLGCEPFDITEVAGADTLYEASGIIKKSEENASGLFGSRRTFYSTEGSSQCIKAMVYLAVTKRDKRRKPLIVAARNAHRAFLQAVALCGADVCWLMPDGSAYSSASRTAYDSAARAGDTYFKAAGTACDIYAGASCRDYCAENAPAGSAEGCTAGAPSSYLSCPVTPKTLEETLCGPGKGACAVYLTSPGYLGTMQDIQAISSVCKKHGVPLLVDNAHGAYLHFLEKPIHPLDLGASICCDSAHKTLPVLTGGAYLHVSENAPESFAGGAKQALSLFGSTSPSYLILSSLDLCNKYLSEGYREKLGKTAVLSEGVKNKLRLNGWDVLKTAPLHISITGNVLTAAKKLRRAGIEPEYAGRDALVLMVTPENGENWGEEVLCVIGKNGAPSGRDDACKEDTGPVFFKEAGRTSALLLIKLPEKAIGIREAVFSPNKTVSINEALGRTAALPDVSCPPAVPIVMPGEIIGEEEIKVLKYYGYGEISVVEPFKQ